MKNISKFATIVALFLVSLVYANMKDGLPTFPEYSKTMDSGVDCTASCFFNSCSGKGTCSCTCSFFSCNCSPSNPKDKSPKLINDDLEQSNDDLEQSNDDYFTQSNKVKVEDISINETQYNRIKNLAIYLKEIKTIETDNAYICLVKLIDSFKNKNDNTFNDDRNNYILSLKNLPLETKLKLNKYFEKIGAKERV